ncbi:FAD-dependent monooxygenase [Gilliamella sp. B2776]|uniref:FAD-dependent monooxygenase n=1 Tax=unclassified Gilliamella TaxID=2685620 RepID=UPI00226ACC53|nr:MULTISPECIES: FAD-dependent monooxygenase [unclassified Gilliamella]MCX8649353.1 FAD-dependent monooxygenase [Gilliamella sp. B2779]MCX8654786.1 FAD-dependent monooxygenase [Gilliamella sp. B2737]MCX8655806.1 FAD-dependent monooxygenase [Gilliamella sp. B2894]MCX8663909.1 FAD-dependent monooxygenase [Gilliamella sp. B2887]MCX8691152.1 FAD-dependent monooxygenase [Gilliamella sp. B2776]
MNTYFDVAIVGGGLVGLATACALSQYDLKIAIIDARVHCYESFPHHEIGVRASAINGASQRYLSKIGIWSDLFNSHRVQEFTEIGVWEKNGLAHLSAHAKDYGYPNLGYIIENNLISHCLYQFAEENHNITIFNLTAIDNTYNADYAFLTLSDNTILQAKLIVGADGAHSWLRNHEKISVFERNYLHHALITTVETQYPHQSCAKQIFYPNGIVAFLPLWQENKSCLVWSTKPDQTTMLTSLSEYKFCQELFKLTDDKIGKCQVINKRTVFPLKARLARQFIKHRLVLIGDAAHTIHPLAGQGVNLGFQDSALLVSTIKQLHDKQKDFGLAENLKSFQFTRRKDTLVMLTAMRTIQDMFHGDNILKKTLRTIGMNAIDNCSPLKKQLIKYAMHI